MAKFKVTIVRTITTNVFIEADSALAAREAIEKHGIIQSALDMGDRDEVSARIFSVTPVDGV